MPAKKWSEIDGLRALCAIAVMFQHWGPSGQETFDPGGIGVGIFFAISGFLITGILLDYRDRMSAEGDFWRAMKVFYARRALRIFPVYYAILLGCLALVALGRLTVAGLPWHFAYLSNAYVFVHRAFPPVVGHLWSLSVEEQFYALWPAVVLLTPKAALRPLILAMIAFGVSCRLGLTLAGFDSASQAGPLLPTCLDNLGIGALLATLTRERSLSSRANLLAGAAGVTSYVGIVLFASAYGWRLPSVATHISIGLIGFALLSAIVSRQRVTALSCLNWSPLQYLGMISYGLYLYHPFVAYGVGLASLHLIHHALPLWPRLAACFLANVAIASASWVLLEKPILGLKRRFDYGPRRSQPAAGPIASAVGAHETGLL